MNNTKILAINKEKVIYLVKFIALLSTATLAPLLQQQAIAGPLVNATLFIAVMLLGTKNAILIGLIPSLIALSTGLLPPVLAPMIPYIMVGNTLLILAFGYFQKKNYWSGVVLASVLKFAFLFATSSLVMNLILKKEIAQKVATMLSWTQLLTALAGGILAYAFFKLYKRKLSNK